MMDAEKAKKVGEIFVKWNNREMTGDHAMYEVSKLFSDETLAAWRVHCKKVAEAIH